MRLFRKDLDWAASEGVIDDAQAEALWQALTRRDENKPKFDLIHVAYYFGALLVIGAMGWFMGNAWEAFGGGGIFLISLAYAAAFLTVGSLLWRGPSLRVPGGLLITMAVCMTPLAVYGLQRWAGVWGFDDPGEYRDFHRWIRGGWFAMEIATLGAGLLALRFFRFPFLTAPIAFVLWFLSMDLTPILSGGGFSFTSTLRLEVSLWFGVAMIAGAYCIDRRTEEDYAFWVYLFGLFAFWGGLSLMNSDSEISKFLYCLINVALMWLSIFLGRRAFMVFGALGVFGYVAHLADLFEDSFLFPFVLTAIGLLVIFLGIQLKRHGARVGRAIENTMPGWMKRLRPAERPS